MSLHSYSEPTSVWSGLEPLIYHTGGEHANDYTTDVIDSKSSKSIKPNIHKIEIYYFCQYNQIKTNILSFDSHTNTIKKKRQMGITARAKLGKDV